MRFCTSCGKQLQDNMRICPYCGQSVSMPDKGKDPVEGMGQQPGMYSGMRSKTDNIFSSLLYEKTLGSILEFSVWCSICLGVLLLFLAAVLTGDKDVPSRYTNGFQMLWIFTLIFSAGIGAVMVFRKMKPITIYASQVILQCILFIAYYCVMAGRFSAIVKMMNTSKADLEGTGFILAVFILAVLTVAALVVCSSIHFFSNIDLGKVISVLSIVFSSLLFILILLIYFSPYIEADDEKYHLFAKIEDHDDTAGWGWKGSCFWLGSFAFLIINVAISVYTVLFFSGVIENRKNKIYVIASGANTYMHQNPQPMIQCLSGNYSGQIFYLQGIEFTIGSRQGVSLVVPDPNISRMHCGIRFNVAAGMYEVRDVSTNGVYLTNGFRLQKGIYTPLQRGTVICLGSVNQQFKLL